MPMPKTRQTPTNHQTPNGESSSFFRSSSLAVAVSFTAVPCGAGPVAFSRSTRSVPPKSRGSVPVAWAARTSWA